MKQIQKPMHAWGMMLVFLLCLTIYMPSIEAQVYYVPQVEWSPDGELVAVILGEQVEIRSVDSQETLYTLEGHTDDIPMVAWSPDGSLLATPSYDETIKIWDVNEGTPRFTLAGHEDAVEAVSWTPDSRQLLGWGSDTTRLNLLRWDITTGEILNQYSGGNPDDISFSPDGEKFAIMTGLSLVLVEPANIELLARSPWTPCCANRLSTVTWSPDSTLIATGSLNGLVSLWDADTAEITAQYIANPYHADDSRDVEDLTLSWVRDVTFSPDGQQVFSVSGDGTLRAWDIASGDVVYDMQIDPLATAQFSPFTGRLAVLEMTMTDNTDTEYSVDNLAGDLTITVPFASPEHLETILQACEIPEAIVTLLMQQVQAGQLDMLLNTLSELPDTTPPACLPDIRALAEAIISP